MRGGGAGVFILPQEKELLCIGSVRVEARNQLTTPTKQLVIIKFHKLLFSYKGQVILIT